jgi:hypothetical protein
MFVMIYASRIQSPTEDPWAGARDAARDDVVATLGAGERTCPHCGSVQPSSGGRRCTNCGQDMTARYAKPRNWRRIAIIAAVVLFVAAVSYPIVDVLRGDASDERAAAEKERQALIQAERERLEKDIQPVRAQGPALPAGTDPVAFRADLVADGERRIAEDARGRVAAGTIKGDIKGAHCSPYPVTEARKAAETAASTPKGRYDCVAFTSKFDAPNRGEEKRTGYFGFPYWLVVDYGTSKLVWCKVTPRAGEGGSVLASVPVPPPCRDPEGPG